MQDLKENHILIGLGGTGGKILKAFKMRMFEEFPDKTERQKQPIALLYIDSTREMMGKGRRDMDVMGQDAGFDENEFLFIKGCEVPDLLDNFDNHPEIRGIVNNVNAVRTAIGNLGEAAGQKRRAGRLLFAVNAQKYVNAVKNCFIKCSENSKNKSKNIHIFTGLSGGTGSGAIIDAICQVRNIDGWEDAVINVYAMIPEQHLPKPDIDKGRYYENGYAALRELNALQCGIFKPSDISNNGEALNLFSDKIKGVANGIALYSNVNANGIMVDSFTELPKIVSDFVYSRIFLMDGEECQDLIRAFNYENMDDFAFEYDERIAPNEIIENQELPAVRTKKLMSFGIKRVIYPETRILKHMTYSLGQKILFQFRYNNWANGVGYVDVEPEKDYRAEYLTSENLSRWMLDEEHLTLEQEILPSGNEKFDTFYSDWKSRVADFAEWCKEQSDDPLNELYGQMDAMFNNSFRNEGVANYYKNKRRAIDSLARKVRQGIEKELFDMWRDGEISIVELSKIGRELSNYVVSDLKAEISQSLLDRKEDLTASNYDLETKREEWNDVGIIGRIAGRKKDRYSDYQDVLVNNLDIRTQVEGLEFARDLVSELQREIGGMSDDIQAFSSRLNDAIDETTRLITSQRKKNNGIEDVKGAVIEVSEEDQMLKYEEATSLTKDGMINFARQIRESILPKTDFKGFGNLCKSVTVDKIINVFDVKLSEIVIQQHTNLPNNAPRVLGLNILSQLKQKLGSSEQSLKEFANRILKESGAYINLDRNQLISNIRNNERPLEGTNINISEILISIPTVEDNDELVEFANQLKKAFESETRTGVKKPRIYMNSPRKNEMSIITISSAFPMRTITWLQGYQKKYEKKLHSGNVNDDLRNSILLHSEAIDEGMPDIFAIPDSLLKEMDAEKNKTKCGNKQPPVLSAQQMPPMPSQTHLQVYIAVDGQQYGPYSDSIIKDLVAMGRLTPATLVWMPGMAVWTKASEVAELKSLFPAYSGVANGMPPIPGTVPPAIN